MDKNYVFVGKDKIEKVLEASKDNDKICSVYLSLLFNDGSITHNQLKENLNMSDKDIIRSIYGLDKLDMIKHNGAKIIGKIKLNNSEDLQYQVHTILLMFRNDNDTVRYFKVTTASGIAYVECRSQEVYIKETINEKETEWAGTYIAGTSRLISIGADFSKMVYEY